MISDMTRVTPIRSMVVRAWGRGGWLVPLPMRELRPRGVRSGMLGLRPETRSVGRVAWQDEAS
jgi:hypothetical protein